MEEKFDFIGIVNSEGRKQLVMIDFIAHVSETTDGCLIHLKNGDVIKSGFSFSEVESMLDIIYNEEID